MKHTPGPWFVDTVAITEATISTKQADPTLGYGSWEKLAVAFGCEDDLKVGREVMLANARLIAAAPELLDVARGARSVIRMADKSHAWRAERDRILEELDAALAKAEGRT